MGPDIFLLNYHELVFDGFIDNIASIGLLFFVIEKVAISSKPDVPKAKRK